MSKKSLEAAIRELALKDTDFRKRLIADPKAALEKDLGFHLPAGTKLVIHEESDTVRHMVLPPPVAAAGADLSDEQLANVAGGMRAAGGSCQGPDSLCGGGCCTCGSKTAQTLFTK